MEAGSRVLQHGMAVRISLLSACGGVGVSDALLPSRCFHLCRLSLDADDAASLVLLNGAAARRLNGQAQTYLDSSFICRGEQ